MKNQKNVVFAALTAVVLALAVLLFASPYIALHSIKKALDAQDATRLSQYVDFPVLRENLKGKLMESMAAKLPPSQDPDNPFGGIGKMIGGVVIGAAVDGLVSPASVMMVMQSGQVAPKTPSSTRPSQEPPSESQTQPAPSTPEQVASRNFSVDYQGFNLVRVYRKSDPDTDFYFRRDGLMGWKLIDMNLRGM